MKRVVVDNQRRRFKPDELANGFFVGLCWNRGIKSRDRIRKPTRQNSLVVSVTLGCRFAGSDRNNLPG
jgi:hypothetical protein